MYNLSILYQHVNNNTCWNKYIIYCYSRTTHENNKYKKQKVKMLLGESFSNVIKFIINQYKNAV